MDKLQPVAWINRDEYHGWLNWDKNTEMPINIPLYTHPVNVTYELTMEKCRQQQADLKDADKYALKLERLYEDAKAEIEALKDKLMLTKQSLEIVEGWIKK